MKRKPAVNIMPIVGTCMDIFMHITQKSSPPVTKGQSTSHPQRPSETEHAVEQTMEFTVIWDATVVMWYQRNTLIT